MESVTFEQPAASTAPPALSANTPLTTALRDSAAIRRLMEEVRCEDMSGTSAKLGYDRAHNRHNRS